MNNQGIVTSKTTVARNMATMGISARSKRKYTITTDSSHNFRVADNLLNRNFKAEAPNQVWTSDITYILCNSTFLYLTVFMDLFDRAIMGWVLSDNLTAKDTSIAAFHKAVHNRNIKHNDSQRIMIHSDRGVQYACNDFVNAIGQYNTIQSMSRKGNCWDNAVTESFFKTIKTERLDDVNFSSFDMARSFIFRYIDGWYNTKRIHSSLNGLAPLEFYYKNVLHLAA